MCFVLVNSTKAFQKGFQSILLVMRRKLIGRRCCFYIDGIQKCTEVFKLKIFNLHIQNSRQCSFVCPNFVLFQIIRTACFYYIICFFRFIQFVLLYNRNNKGTFNSLFREVSKKVQHTIKFYTKFQGAFKSTFMLFCSNFYAVPFFFILEICK